jgi:hypothetical protein
VRERAKQIRQGRIFQTEAKANAKTLAKVCQACSKHSKSRCQWLTSVILATQEAEIRRITVQSQPGLAS